MTPVRTLLITVFGGAQSNGDQYLIVSLHVTYIVHRITVFPDRVEISVRQGPILSPDITPVENEATFVITVPVELKRCGLSVRLIVRVPGYEAPREPNSKLIGLLSKAHDWFEKLTSGRYDSICAIAQEENLTRNYVTRVINLAFLAPDIVQKIIQGQQPIELFARRLIRMGPLPLAWKDQRILLGMANSR